METAVTRVALVTRADQHAARVAAEALAASGIRVYAAGDPSPGHVSWEKGIARSIVPMQHDCCVAESWHTLVEAIVNEAGRIDFLVNGPPVVDHRPLSEMSLEAFQRLARLNITAPWLGLRHVVPVMKEAGGVIINLAAAIDGHRKAGPALQAATHALRMMSAAAALELGESGAKIRINCLEYVEEVGDAELARAVMMLADETSSFMTGSRLTLCGNQTRRGAAQ